MDKGHYMSHYHHLYTHIYNKESTLTPTIKRSSDCEAMATGTVEKHYSCIQMLLNNRLLS